MAKVCAISANIANQTRNALRSLAGSGSAQPLTEFAQFRAVLDPDEDGPERRNDRTSDGDLRHS